MRHNVRKSSKNRGGQKKNIKTRVFESNGPDAKIRGTAYQVTEKYEALAKDADTSGNYVLAENYRQHAEHYQRIINTFEEEMKANAKPVKEKKAPVADVVDTTDNVDEGDIVVDKNMSVSNEAKVDVSVDHHVSTGDDVKEPALA